MTTEGELVAVAERCHDELTDSCLVADAADGVSDSKLRVTSDVPLR